MDGIIVIKKEKGYTSHDVVAKLRGILHMKKIGHTGTLDPQAEGVLPVALGKATRLVDMLIDKEKTYEAVIRLGIDTDTQDMTGEIQKETKVTVTETEVKEAVMSFVGEQMQIPPMYSALKVNGKKLYELAREGKTIERKARPVTLYELKILKMDLPRVSIAITCSKGTYIRSLCRDIGEKLGCGGCMEELIRTRVGHFQIENALTLSQVEALMKQDRILEVIEPTDRVFAACPAVYAGEQDRKLVHNGNPVSEAGLALDDSMKKPGQWLRLYDDQEEFIGIYQYDAGKKRIKPVKMFLV
jgi:tRNA pseudouridine55 synthase